MKFKEKLLILIVAVVVSVLGFNLIASSSVCLLKAAKEAGLETFDHYQTRCDADVYRAHQISDKTEFSHLALLEKEEKNGR